jgi:hypothetical protein
MERVHLADARQVEVSHAQMVLAVLQFPESARTDVAAELRKRFVRKRFIRIVFVRFDVMTEFLFSRHGLLTNDAVESRAVKIKN